MQRTTATRLHNAVRLASRPNLRRNGRSIYLPDRTLWTPDGSRTANESKLLLERRKLQSWMDFVVAIFLRESRVNYETSHVFPLGKAYNLREGSPWVRAEACLLPTQGTASSPDQPISLWPQPSSRHGISLFEEENVQHMILSPNEAWHRSSRLLQPTFEFPQLAGSSQPFHRSGRSIINCLLSVSSALLISPFSPELSLIVMRREAFSLPRLVLQSSCARFPRKTASATIPDIGLRPSPNMLGPAPPRPAETGDPFLRRPTPALSAK
jgi:hypothetical protein